MKSILLQPAGTRIGPDSRRSLLGVSVALSEAEVHWRLFLDSLVRRGLRGVQFITSDDHAGIGAARRAAFGGVIPSDLRADSYSLLIRLDVVRFDRPVLTTERDDDGSDHSDGA